MKNLFRLTMLFALLFSLSACGSPQSEAIVSFVEDGCTYDGPDGVVDNPVVFRYTNTNNHENFGIAIVTLQEGYGREDLEAYQGFGEPAFLDHFVTLLYNSPGETTTSEFTLDAGREHFIVCGRDGGPVVSVLAVLTPK